VVGLVWTELTTPHPVIQPVYGIDARNGIFDAETDRRRVSRMDEHDVPDVFAGATPI
jgi:hypothetical protein